MTEETKWGTPIGENRGCFAPSHETLSLFQSLNNTVPPGDDDDKDQVTAKIQPSIPPSDTPTQTQPHPPFQLCGKWPSLQNYCQ